MGTEANPSIYNPGGETTMGLNNSGISDSGYGYFINKEKEAAGDRARARDALFAKQEQERKADQGAREAEVAADVKKEQTDKK